MKSVVTRPIDKLGRIVLPQEMRKAEGLRLGTQMGIFIESNGDIILRKANVECLLCGATTNLKGANEKMLCVTCIAEITRTGSVWNK